MIVCLREASVVGKTRVGFIGGSEQGIQEICSRVCAKFGGLNVIYSMSSRFLVLTNEEKTKIVEKINSSVVQLLFIELECPKQGICMNEDKGIVNVVMIGVGAAFDMHAGAKAGDPRFVILTIKQILDV